MQQRTHTTEEKPQSGSGVDLSGTRLLKVLDRAAAPSNIHIRMCTHERRSSVPGPCLQHSVDVRQVPHGPCIASPLIGLNLPLRTHERLSGAFKSLPRTNVVVIGDKMIGSKGIGHTLNHCNSCTHSQTISLWCRNVGTIRMVQCKFRTEASLD